MSRRKNAGLSSLVLVFASASSTPAAESPAEIPRASAGPAVVVDCSLLSEDERASVEARARADLAIKGLAGGVLSITCAEGMGQASFRWRELTETRAGVLPDSSRAVVEGLLQLVDSVTTEADALTTERASAETAAASASVVEAPVQSARPAAEVAPARAARSTRPEQAHPWHVGAGVEAEVWATEASGALGLRLRAGRELTRPLALSAVVAVDAASAEPEAVTVHVWRAGLEGAACASQSVCIVLGAQLTWMVAKGPADWSPASHARTSFAGSLRLEYVFDVGALEVVPGAGVLFYPASRTVTLNDERVLSVPQLTGSLILELRHRF